LLLRLLYQTTKSEGKKPKGVGKWAKRRIPL
jgi:hypothetical protein